MPIPTREEEFEFEATLCDGCRKAKAIAMQKWVQRDGNIIDEGIGYCAPCFLAETDLSLPMEIEEAYEDELLVAAQDSIEKDA